MEENFQYKIIIWGTGNTAREAIKYLSDGIEVIGVCDNDPNISGFEKFKLIDWRKLKETDYDYIVICSIYFSEIYRQLLDIDILSSQILIYDYLKSERYRIYSMNFFENKYTRLLKQDKPQIMISGISYHNDGIDENVFEKFGKKAFNFALRGQDLFYDWKIANILKQEGFFSDLDYYIIGLSYYSFEYDLSKSRNAWEIVSYYPYIKDAHNLMPQYWFAEYVEKERTEILDGKIQYLLFSKRNRYELNLSEAKECAKSDYNKNYPVTVWENKKILKAFISCLKKSGICPIILIMPAMKEYVENCPKYIIKKFYDNLDECLENEQIQVLDYFGKYYGYREDWYHVTHFNKTGAKKFTMKLAKDIMW